MLKGNSDVRMVSKLNGLNMSGYTYGAISQQDGRKILVANSLGNTDSQRLHTDAQICVYQVNDGKIVKEEFFYTVQPKKA